MLNQIEENELETKGLLQEVEDLKRHTSKIKQKVVSKGIEE